MLSQKNRLPIKKNSFHPRYINLVIWYIMIFKKFDPFIVFYCIFIFKEISSKYIFYWVYFLATTFIPHCMYTSSVIREWQVIHGRMFFCIFFIKGLVQCTQHYTCTLDKWFIPRYQKKHHFNLSPCISSVSMLYRVV